MSLSNQRKAVLHEVPPLWGNFAPIAPIDSHFFKFLALQYNLDGFRECSPQRAFVIRNLKIASVATTCWFFSRSAWRVYGVTQLFHWKKFPFNLYLVPVLISGEADISLHVQRYLKVNWLPASMWQMWLIGKSLARKLVLICCVDNVSWPEKKN